MVIPADCLLSCYCAGKWSAGMPEAHFTLSAINIDKDIVE